MTYSQVSPVYFTPQVIFTSQFSYTHITKISQKCALKTRTPDSKIWDWICITHLWISSSNLFKKSLSFSLSLKDVLQCVRAQFLFVSLITAQKLLSVWLGIPWRSIKRTEHKVSLFQNHKRSSLVSWTRFKHKPTNRSVYKHAAPNSRST